MSELNTNETLAVDAASPEIPADVHAHIDFSSINFNDPAAIEAIDRLILGRLQEALGDSDYRILLTPDHPTPICYMTHIADPVPFVLYDNRGKRSYDRRYTEAEAKATGLYLPEGYRLMDLLIRGEI